MAGERRPWEENETSNIMNKQKHADSNDLGTLAEDARALMTATADVAGEKVGQARQRLAEALECSKQMYNRAREKAAEKARAADEAVRDHPYQAIGIAFGVGALVGLLVARRRTRERD